MPPPPSDLPIKFSLNRCIYSPTCLAWWLWRVANVTSVGPSFYWRSFHTHWIPSKAWFPRSLGNLRPALGLQLHCCFGIVQHFWTCACFVFGGLRLFPCWLWLLGPWTQEASSSHHRHSTDSQTTLPAILKGRLPTGSIALSLLALGTGSLTTMMLCIQPSHGLYWSDTQHCYAFYARRRTIY